MPDGSKLETVIACVDGSDLATESVQEGLALLQPAERLIVATVVEPIDPTLVTGTGMAGGVVSGTEYDELEQLALQRGQSIAQDAAKALGLANAEIKILRGEPGIALCNFAEEQDARALVMGSRGRGGIKRALLGSVSDYVVRNAPCPVVITGPKG
jgi:nucleotide-binding universal stress UspA family protein